MKQNKKHINKAKENEYEVCIKCENCDEINVFYVEKGHPAWHALANSRCYNCKNIVSENAHERRKWKSL